MFPRKLAISLCFLTFSFALMAVVPIWAGSHSTAAFKKLQSLAGEWEGKDDQGMTVKTSFKVAAADTAIIETISPHGMEEMVTLYSADGDGIALVHYCPTNNQPRMRAVPMGDDVRELVFTFQSATNLASPMTGHQHQLVLRFEDADHITETWTWRQNGKDTPMVFHLARKKI